MKGAAQQLVWFDDSPGTDSHKHQIAFSKRMQIFSDLKSLVKNVRKKTNLFEAEDEKSLRSHHLIDEASGCIAPQFTGTVFTAHWCQL